MSFFENISYNVFPWILLLFFLYFLLLLINSLVIFYKAKRKDPTMEHCLSQRGIICLVLLTVAFLAILIFTIYAFITKLNKEGIMSAMQNINLIAIFTLVYALEIQNVIMVGKKNILIGNTLFEYRKMKKITYPKGKKLSFVYSQKDIQTSLFFIDVTKLKSALSKAK